MVSDNDADPGDARRALSSALRQWNSTPAADQPQAPSRQEVAAILSRQDREAAQEEQQAAEARIAALEGQLAELNAKLDKLVTNTAPPVERRSQMSAKRKSELLRSIGLDKYNRIPW